MNYSIINSLDKNQLQKLVDDNNCISDILKHLGLTPHGGSRKTLLNRLQKNNISINELKERRHIDKTLRLLKLKNSNTPLSEILIENSSYNRVHLKNRLIREGILKNECSECGLKLLWNNKEIILIIDHINGIYNDNRLDNLRLLCPNCNSQTPTFCGRNIKYERNNCIDCLKVIKKSSTRCIECNKINKHILSFTSIKKPTEKKRILKSPEELNTSAINRRKVKNRPLLEELINQVENIGYVETGKIHGVSGAAIKKWICNYIKGTNIKLPRKKKELLIRKNRGIYKPRKETRKVNRPSPEILLQNIQDMGIRGTGRFYGVTPSTIKSWVKIYKKYPNQMIL